MSTPNMKLITPDSAATEPNGQRLFPERKTLADIRAALCAPFPIHQVEVKPTATTANKDKGLAAAYVDARHYQQRLDNVAGPDNWSVEYRPVSDRATVCRVAIFGVVREDIGETDAGDPNQATSAAMQAFKRACAAFGLGRYLYTDLPKLWVECKAQGKNTVIADPAGAVQQMYDNAGIQLDKRGQYIHKIQIIMSGMDEAALIALGKSLSSKAQI